MMKKLVLFTALSSWLLTPVALVQAADQSSSVTAEEALVRLKAGNARFVEDKGTHAGADAARRKETARGQQPFVTILGCSDSRVPLETVFDQGIGDVFAIRVAGNICDVNEMGSIEYGVGPLGTHLLVVLGHSDCGR